MLGGAIEAEEEKRKSSLRYLVMKNRQIKLKIVKKGRKLKKKKKMLDRAIETEAEREKIQTEQLKIHGS